MRRFIPAVGFLVAFGLAAPILALATPARAEDKVVFFAAASLKTALDAAAKKFHAAGGAEVSISYGSSLTLMKQILAGAPADLFASADEASMDEGAKGNVLREGTRVDLLTNTLVVIAPKESALTTVTFDHEGFAKAVGDGKIATGEITTVPVGKYAKAALTKLGDWDVAEPHLAMTPDVRTALAFVARGEAPLGIVYATDAAAEPGVKIVATFAEDTHPPIRYPFALIAASKNPEADKFFAYLKGPEARALFDAQGFGKP